MGNAAALKMFREAVEIETSAQAVEAVLTECNGIVTIGSTAEHLAAGAALQRVTKLEKAVELQRTTAKKPYLETCKEIDDLGRQLGTPLTVAKEQLAERMAGYEQNRDRQNLVAAADEAGVVVLAAEGGTPYTKTTKKKKWRVIGEDQVPLQYMRHVGYVVDQEAIEAALKSGELDPAENDWLVVDTEYKVSSR